ncbi:KTSC domain-containing protein [Jiangella alkaliphila]|uniref:KTSC domain-containing protein n=2 Tax=Jiangella alkaliphila TaxID=419479 RepID=A0A1H2JB88_9ACTN|nr:KTSC domain-containing protein [Jiangella alkaliphila]
MAPTIDSMGRIRRWPVSSSALRSVGYDPQTWTLEVEFESGAVYRYLDVDPLDVEAMMAADSMGAYLNEEIKPHHEVEQVDP